MRRLAWFIALLALTGSARGQTDFSYRYWFDNTPATLQTGTADGETEIEIEVSLLAKGSVHALHLQGLDARNQWSPVRTTYFFLAKTISPGGVVSRYWYDNDLTTLKMASPVNGLIDLDISSLAVGIHAVHYQMFNAVGEASPVQTAYFFLAKESDTESVTARYWYDNDEATLQTAPTTNGLFDLDISHMDIGIHAVHYQTFNAAGDASPVRTTFFYVDELQLATLSCRIWIDDASDEAQTFDLTGEDIEIEAEDLSVGMHDLHVILLDEYGLQLAEATATFEVKEPTVVISLNSLIETFCSGKDLDFSSVPELRAYTATGFRKQNGDVMLSRIYDAPAGEGLVLKGEPGTYEVPVRKSYSYYANLLVGTTESIVLTHTSDGYDNYLLSLRDGDYGFFLAEDGNTLEAGKAYLHIPSEKVAGAQSLRIAFDEAPDGVESPLEETEEEGAIYNLAGQRLSKMQRGINIVNGKKVAVK